MAGVTSWDRADLIRRLCQSLDVAKQAVRSLAQDGYQDDRDSADSVRPEKVISETALLLYASSHLVDIQEVGARIQALAELLSPHARSARMRAGVCFEPALAMDYAQAHACLHKLGFRDEAFGTLLRVTVDSQAFGNRERAPHRTLEQGWIAALCGLQIPGLRRQSSLAASVSAMARSPDLLNGSREDAYALTHAIMYATDFGFSRARLPRCRKDILREAEALLAGCLDTEDYDLAGELLLAWPLTGESWSSIATFAFKVLASVEDDAGFLPSAGTRIDKANSLTGERRAGYLLSSAYHTIYVMGLLAAASLKQRRAPPSQLHRVEAMPERDSDSILSVYHLEDAPHWQRIAEQLPREEQNALTELFLIIAVRRAVRVRDFETVHRTLLRALQGDVADGPLWSQASELINRVQVYAQYQ